MLPKEEKIIKKKSTDVDQPGLFDKEDEKKRLQKKRRFIFAALILTAGLSLSFWVYRSVKNIDFSLKIPSINFPIFFQKNSSIKTKSDISLPKDSNSTWSVFLKQIESDTIIYQNDIQDVDSNSILEQIDKLNFVTSSVYASSLPEGLKIKEITEKKDNSFSYISTITTPNQELLLIIKITNSQNLDQSIKLIPDFINQLYWYSLQK